MQLDDEKLFQERSTVILKLETEPLNNAVLSVIFKEIINKYIPTIHYIALHRNLQNVRKSNCF